MKIELNHTLWFILGVDSFQHMMIYWVSTSSKDIKEVDLNHTSSKQIVEIDLKIT